MPPESENALRESKLLRSTPFGHDDQTTFRNGCLAATAVNDEKPPRASMSQPGVMGTFGPPHNRIPRMV